MDPRLPHHLQQAISANQARLIQQLRNENARLKADRASSHDSSLQALVEEKFRRYTDRIGQLEGQLAQRNAQIEQKAAELDEHYDENTKLRLQVQVNEGLINQQAAKINQQTGELKELGSENQHLSLQIQRLEDTIRQQVDRIEQSNFRSQQLHRDNTDLQSSKEQLQNLFSQEVLRRLGEILASALSAQSVAHNNRGQQLDQAVSMTQDHQIKERLDKLERKCRGLEDPNEE